MNPNSYLTYFTWMIIAGVFLTAIGTIGYFIFNSMVIKQKEESNKQLISQLSDRISTTEKVPPWKTDILEPLAWMVGKVFVPYKKQYAFQGTGFAFKHGPKTYFITSYNLILEIQKIFRQDAPIFVQFPNIRTDLFKSRFLFFEPLEDSAVFAIDDLIFEGNFNNRYESPLSLQRDQDIIIIMGYPTSRYNQKEPQVIFNRFLSIATLNQQTNIINLTPDFKKEDKVIQLSKGELTSMGMGGGPVFKSNSSIVVGMSKGFADDKKDKRIFSLLRVSEFNIFVPLDRTIYNIKRLQNK